MWKYNPRWDPLRKTRPGACIIKLFMGVIISVTLKASVFVKAEESY
jgi:hypothetical protein